MRLRTLGAVCATSAVAAPLPAYVQNAAARVPATTPAPPATAPPAATQPATPPDPQQPAAAAAPAPARTQPAQPALAPTATAATTAVAPPPGVTPPGDLHRAGMALLTDRHVHFARRYHRLLGDPMTRDERQALRHHVASLTSYKLRVETRVLRGDIRHLRRKLERKVAGGAPDVAIPPQLSAIAQCESGGDPRAISSSGTYRGKYQFSFTTWATVGGTGDPAAAPETEQDRRAAILYRQEGPGQWPVCGR